MVIHMIIYVFLFFCSPFIFISVNMNRDSLAKLNYKSYLPILFLFAICITLLLGLRDSGGADDLSYRIFYEKGYGQSKLMGILPVKEPIFILFREIGIFLNLNYKMLFLLYGLATSFFMYEALKKYINSIYDAIMYVSAYFVIVYSAMFTVMRQSLAMAIILYIHTLDKKKDKKKYIICWILAILSHYSAIIPFFIDIILFLKKKPFNYLLKILIPLVSLFIGYFINLQKIVDIIISPFNGLYSYMSGEENFSTEVQHSIVNYVLFLIYIIEIVLSNKLLTKKIKEKDLISEKIETNQMIYFSLVFLTIKMRWGNRLSLFYILFLPFLIVNFIKRFRLGKKRWFIYFVIGIIFGAWFAYILFANIGLWEYQWSLIFK